MIAVVDTSVWVSALITSVTSREILGELRDVLHRSRIRIKYGLVPEAISLHVRKIEDHSVLVTIEAPLKLCRDPWDDHLIAAARAAKADCLVSRDDDLKGDADLVRTCAAMGIRVVSVRAFLAALAQ